MARTLLSVPEARKRLNVGHTTIYRLLGSGQLGSVKIGTRRLVPEDAVDAYIARLQSEQGDAA